MLDTSLLGMESNKAYLSVEGQYMMHMLWLSWVMMPATFVLLCMAKDLALSTMACFPWMMIPSSFFFVTVAEWCKQMNSCTQSPSLFVSTFFKASKTDKTPLLAWDLLDMCMISMTLCLIFSCLPVMMMCPVTNATAMCRHAVVHMTLPNGWNMGEHWLSHSVTVIASIFSRNQKHWKYQAKCCLLIVDGVAAADPKGRSQDAADDDEEVNLSFGTTDGAFSLSSSACF